MERKTDTYVFIRGRKTEKDIRKDKGREKIVWEREERERKREIKRKREGEKEREMGRKREGNTDN